MIKVFISNENFLQHCFIRNENSWTYRWRKDQLRLGGVNTIKNYTGCMENSWLMFTVNVYDFSVKRQQIAPKKIYCIETGLVIKVGFGFSPNTGKLLENFVFLAIRRLHRKSTISRHRVDTRWIFTYLKHVSSFKSLKT